MKSILDTHCHTSASGHAYGTAGEYARSAAAKGLKLIALTDHGPEMADTTTESHFVSLKYLPRIVEGVEILPGAEINIMDYNGRLDLADKILDRLKVVIVSLHPPCVEPGTKAQNTRAVISAMENPRVNVVGHILDQTYPVDIARIVGAAARTRTAIEINESSLHPLNFRYCGDGAFLEMLRLCDKAGVFVVASSDAHVVERVGELKRAMRVIEKSGISRELVLNDSVEKMKRALGV